MLKTLEAAFATGTLEAPGNTRVSFHSHTSKEQGLFLQKMFDIAKPTSSLEIGLAFGISTLFILERHRQRGNPSHSHLAIEPFPEAWGGVAEFNIQKEKLAELVTIEYASSDEVLPRLQSRGHRIQFVYVDTTKLFDVVLRDFYHLDKMMDIGGIVVFDDCGGGWPGIQRLARFINTLPHYRLLEGHHRVGASIKKRCARLLASSVLKCVPFKAHLYPTCDFTSDAALGLDFNCLAFRKVGEDTRSWSWDVAF